MDSIFTDTHYSTDTDLIYVMVILPNIRTNMQQILEKSEKIAFWIHVPCSSKDDV